MDVLMVGAGEYTAGYVPTAEGAASDKPAGVIAITLFDLRRFGKVRRLVLCDASGKRLPAIRENIRRKIGEVYKDLDTTLETHPPDGAPFDRHAYKGAIAKMKRGDMATIFTPDDTHFEIALECIRHGLHVLLAKPAVQTLAHHLQLTQAAREAGVLVAVEYHKRFDPIYADARARIPALGPFSFFSSTMTQPKKQLDTFAGWAGKSSDISYYLNSHHIDLHSWAVGEASRPVRVTASASDGVASARLGRSVEDTITLLVQWENTDGTHGTAVYMASWIAPPADCHTQQGFHYMGHKGELRVDQAHRGYTTATDAAGFATLNPLYMKYTPSPSGHFAGQLGYGYRSIAEFLERAAAINAGTRSVADCAAEGVLATLDGTARVTAVLEAGRRSLDQGGQPVTIVYDQRGWPIRLE
ncbi:hypothetical protein KFL_001180030 [Klebsormidium nitens]|uniref:Gfo/Idh/MocA-like oxidoreductase N-terminal domain-containing protein n=1 Tax=Klebsormidium nitens TaxID=105231 RepID=A0A1Y1HVG7_KLENI|nr:hypothetical protein KFL_001180030 [Klebsormidium nitens]|eukprot:GAQ82624.1 hypothetical protein KFL_001180030 [Klebsormidium nitens]